MAAPVVSGPSYGQVFVDDKGTAKMAQLVSGLDLNAMANAISDGKKKIAAPLGDEIKVNVDQKIPEINTLSTKTKSLQQAIEKLTNYLGLDSTVTNVFNEKFANAQQIDGSVTVTVGRNAVVNEAPMTLSVVRLASFDTVKSDANHYFPSGTTGLGLSGALALNGQTVNVTNDMGLTDVMNAINAVGPAAGVNASVVMVSANQYRLVITGTDLAHGIDMTGTDPALQGAQGLFLPTVNTDPTTLTAQMNFNGDLVTRNTNSITDLVNGVTFALVKPSVNSQNTVATIDYNKDLALGAINDL
ncbi:MAG: hypothetical protein NTX76_01790 [Alphaproteobacteria bacterium]|nr:hypothetical protein [Alphaproteobacteria bacterium]